MVRLLGNGGEKCVVVRNRRAIWNVFENRLSRMVSDRLETSQVCSAVQTKRFDEDKTEF